MCSMSSGRAAAAQSKMHWYWAHRWQLFSKSLTERGRLRTNLATSRLFQYSTVPVFQSFFPDRVDIIAQAAKFFMTITLKINLTGSRQNAPRRIRHRKKGNRI